MLHRLRIENFILIPSLELGFREGVCLLTGETGAGKSIVFDALSAVTGGRVSAELIRTGADRAHIEATFKLPDRQAIRDLLDAHGIEPAIEGEISLSREITPKGSRCRIDGHLVPQSVLRECGEWLVDILGQHEHYLLTRPRAHLDLLDRYADAQNQRSAVQSLYRRWSDLKAEQERLRDGAAERERQRDFWQFQLAEIEEAQLVSTTEPEDLKAERQLLANAESLKSQMQGAFNRLYAGEHAVVDHLGNVLSELREAARIDPGLQPLVDSLDGAAASIEDAARELRQRFERTEANPERLEAIEVRLDVIRDILRKHGPTVEQVWDRASRLRSDLGEAETADERIAQLEADAERLYADLAAEAQILTARRRAAAEELSAAMERELKQLGMPEARFLVDCRPLPELGAEGAESVEFLLSANPGDPPRPLAKTASGGELARLMLALKTLLIEGDPIPTLLFDEVDSGISGRTAQGVAQKIAELGRRYQILLITHLPAIAAVADRHWHLEKRIEGGQTRLDIELLEDDGVVRELAHLASGNADSEAALSHARELLRAAQTFKEGALR